MKRPLALFVLFYCLGIILVRLLRIDIRILFCLGVVIFIALVLGNGGGRVFPVCIFLAAFILGALNLKCFYVASKRDIGNLVSYGDKTVYALSGFVDSRPYVKDGNTLFVFRAQEIRSGDSGRLCSGRVLVKIDFPCGLRYAERLTVFGVLQRPYAAGTYKDYLRGQGVSLSMRIKSSLQLIRHGHCGGNMLMAYSERLCARLNSRLRRFLPELPAGIVCAMVLGQRDSVPYLVNEMMVKAGTVHILVVSGFNVGIVAFVSGLLLKMARLRRKRRILLVSLFLIGYCLVTGASNPVVRATIMGIFFLCAYLFEREADIYNSLACSGLCILVVNPFQLFDIGFQLSFLSVLSIVYFYPRLSSFLHLTRLKSGPAVFLCEGFLVSFCAWLGTFWIIAYNFKIVSPVTFFANLLVVPLATLITLCGFAILLSSPFFPFAGELIGTTASALVSLLLHINALMMKIPHAYFYL